MTPRHTSHNIIREPRRPPTRRCAPHRLTLLLTVAITTTTSRATPGQSAAAPPAHSDSTRPMPRDTTRNLVSRRDLVMFAGAVLGSIAVAPLDRTVQQAMLADDVHGNRGLRSTATGFAFLGGPGPFVGGAALYLVGRTTNSRRVATLGISLTEGVGLAASLNSLVKGFSGRALPNGATIDPGDFSFGRGFHEGNGPFVSFPSGHTAASFASATVLAKTIKDWNPAAARVVAPAAYATATLVAISRLYQNVHWVSDLPLGAAIGIWSGSTAVAWQRRHPDNWLTRRLLGLTVIPAGRRVTIGEAASLAQ